VAEGTKELIEMGAKRFLEEIPALKQLQLVVRLDLRARRDSQTWRVALPEVDVRKDPAADAKVASRRVPAFRPMSARSSSSMSWR